MTPTDIKNLQSISMVVKEVSSLIKNSDITPEEVEEITEIMQRVANRNQLPFTISPHQIEAAFEEYRDDYYSSSY